MDLRKVVAFICALAAFVDLIFILLLSYGQEKCATLPWYRQVCMYVLENERLGMCKTPVGQFRLGLEVFNEWKPLVFSNDLVLLAMLLLAVIVRDVFKVYTAKFCTIEKKLVEKEEKRTYRNVNVPLEGHIMLDDQTLGKVGRFEGGYGVSIDFERIQNTLKEKNIEYIEMAMPVL